MRKPAGILGSIAKNTKKKATMGATSIVYQAVWGKPPKKPKSK